MKRKTYVMSVHPRQRLAMQAHLISVEFDSSETFESNVKAYLILNAHSGMLLLEDVAENFSITPRSLQRRLREECTTFQQIANTVRKSLALHYIQSGKYQVKEISTLLGYNEVSAFSRAFKRWTGCAPAAYAG